MSFCSALGTLYISAYVRTVHFRYTAHVHVAITYGKISHDTDGIWVKIAEAVSESLTTQGRFFSQEKNGVEFPIVVPSNSNPEEESLGTVPSQRLKICTSPPLND